MMTRRGSRGGTLPRSIFAIGRVGFGLACLALPSAMGYRLVGPGGSTPESQSFVRSIGAREVATGVGVLLASDAAPWLVASIMGDAGDLVGLAREWESLPHGIRETSAALASGAAAAGLMLMIGERRRDHG